MLWDAKGETMIDVSIIIVNWNTRKLLLECIKSIITQECRRSYEIIVVDNASNDDSVEAVKKQYPDIKVIVNKKNEGFARANNIGIKNCSGRYVLLSNTDIKVLDNAVDKMIEFMDANENIGGM